MKFIEVAFIFALLACFAGDIACISSGTSVTNPNEVPYQAAVLCPVIMGSGAIVSTKNVLTTATLIAYLMPADVEVHVGSVTYYSNGYTFKVAAIVTHPKFASSNYDYNIAILTVETAFNFQLSNVKPISLATAEAANNIYYTTTAFGAIDTDLTLPVNLQKTNLQKFSQSVCQQYKSNRLTPSMICAGSVTGEKDLCPADQGAPFVAQNQLYGIYSWGCSCGLAHPVYSTPVFSSIPFVQDWILTNIITP